MSPRTLKHLLDRGQGHQMTVGTTATFWRRRGGDALGRTCLALIPSFLILIMIAAMNGPLHASEIRADERVVFFPTAARRSEDGSQWTADIHGWIFEPEEDSRLRAAALSRIRSVLAVSVDESSREIFEQRARWLLVDNERGKRLTIRVADRTFALRPSSPDGHFFGEIRLADEEIAHLVERGCLRYFAVTDAEDHRVFEGQIHLIDRQGLSVISDIDDTIKVTEVTSKRKLIRNTFLRPFRPVPGMAEAYRRWEKTGAGFHFVSASPWQLYVPLAEMAREAGFPAATYHLKRVRLKDKTVLQLFASPLELKRTLIDEIMAYYPQRSFILVGDSGERDADVYGAIARKYPDRVRKICIRDVSGLPPTAERYRQAFAGVPDDLWMLFQQPDELPDVAPSISR